MTFRSPRFVASAVGSIGLLLLAGVVANLMNLEAGYAVVVGFVAGAAATEVVDYFAEIENGVTS